ncbi:MAG: glycosyltransferase [Candidatus Pacearchaeota archaeon]
MKILIILKKWSGGVGVVVKNIKKELEKRGHYVKVISREEDLKIYSLAKSIFPIRKKIVSLMKKENFDVIYTQDWSLAFSFIFPFRIFKKKHFTCFHGNQLGKTKAMQKIIGKSMGKNLVVVGDSLKRRFPKSNLIYNGVDLDMFKPLHKKRNCLGWINKDTEILSEKDIKILSKSLGLTLLIAKSIPFEDMNSKFYNKCKIFVSLPPKSAGFNLCWIEAMAARVPIIIGNREGIGKKLRINKVKSKKNLFGNIKYFKEKDYRKEIEKSDLTWNNHVDKLVGTWRK